MAKRRAVPTPHDRLIKRVFARPEAAAVILRRALPSVVLDHLDLGRIRALPTTFVGARLGAGYGDLAYSIGLRGAAETLLVFAIVEHQSSPLHLLPLRMFWYVGWLWDRYRSSWGSKLQGIPPVLPIVMVQNPAKWNGPNRLSDLYTVPDALRQALRPRMDLQLWVDDISESVLDDPVAAPEVLALVELTRALLFAYHHPESLTAARVAELAPLLDLVIEHSREDAEALWTYVVSVFDEDSPLRRMLLDTVNQENETMGRTYKEAWLAEGMAKGMAKALLQVLEHRRMAVPPEIQARVLKTQDESILDRWLQRALVAESFEGIFEPAARV